MKFKTQYIVKKFHPKRFHYFHVLDKLLNTFFFAVFILYTV